MPNDDVNECPKFDPVFSNTTVKYGYCMPAQLEDNAAIQRLWQEFYDQLGFAQYISDIREAWLVLVIMGVVTFIITLTYIWMLKCMTKPLLYSSLLIIFALGVGSGYYAFSKTMEIEDTSSNEYKIALAGSIIIWIIVALYTLFVCCSWSSIRLGASVMEAAS